VPNGTWTYTVRARDAAGNLSDPATANAVVTATTSRSFMASADTWVNSAARGVNYGGSATLQTGGRGRIATTYLKFSVPATPAGRTLVGVSLLVRVSTASGSSTLSRQLIRLAGTGWSERSLTWRARVAASTTVVGQLNSARKNGGVYSVELDPDQVGAIVASGGELALAMTTAGRDALTLYSAQSGRWISSPRLVLVYQ